MAIDRRTEAMSGNQGQGDMFGGAAPARSAPAGDKKMTEDIKGYAFDEVASALQKEIRRGDEVAAVYWGLLLQSAAPFYAWKRVLITAAEDIGLGDPVAVQQVCALGMAWWQCKQKSYYVSEHHLTMAIVLLCRAQKSTEVEDLQSLVLEQIGLIDKGQRRPMPEYAVDGHTKRGKAKGLGKTWDDWYANRIRFGIRPNAYTHRLWALKPDWKPADLVALLAQLDGEASADIAEESEDELLDLATAAAPRSAVADREEDEAW